MPVAKNPKSFLIYDANCHFCINIAHFLKDFVVIENLTIVPNTSKKCLSLHKNITRQVIQKDVHLVIFESKTSTIYSGSDAVSKVMSLKENFGFIWKINKFFPLPFKILYFLSKKFKKYTY